MPPLIRWNRASEKAFDPVLGDENDYAGDVKRRNAIERKGQRGLEDLGWSGSVPEGESHRRYVAALDASDDSLVMVAANADVYDRHRRSREFLRRQLQADLWTAAHFWPLLPATPPPPTQGVWRRLVADPKLVDYVDARKNEELRGRPELGTVRLARRLAREHAFFHWELEFEDVFSRDHPGFDVVVGNPP